MPRISNEDYAALGALLSELRSAGDELAKIVAGVEHDPNLDLPPPQRLEGGGAASTPGA